MSYRLSSLRSSWSRRSMIQTVTRRSMSSPKRSQKYFSRARWSRRMSVTSRTSSLGFASFFFAMNGDSAVAVNMVNTLADISGLDKVKCVGIIGCTGCN